MGKKEKEKTKKGVSYNADGTVKTCVFCEIIAEGTRCVYMDEDVAVFPSRAGDAATHLLAVPRRHITSIHTVSREVADAEGLLRALDVRHKLFSPEEVERSVAVFHRPPFTSIDHLHLHILVGDYSTLKARLKHTPGGCWRRWNLSLQEAHARLAACKL
eukprot:TRINITY_DN14487_c0_g1_i1.p2 TRINITY_DN14487_c0_g1~~TRINITY_DN14487_c0_g1_i1.p2  ORF type:complete len:159 (+),score=44.98 TRINITY_DN14487_c0_g1_i1:45-521(+)